MTEKLIELEGVSFAYRKGKLLSEISLAVNGGECVVIAGTNGSGKTTLLSLVAGIQKPTSGRVLTRGRIGYVPQGSALLEDATVRENLRYFADLTRTDPVDPLPFAVGEYLDRKVSRLSGGMKKQVSIACALSGNPQILLLDEPCGALDVRFRDALCSLVLHLKEEGKAILYVGHDPAEFRPFCDRLVFLGRKDGPVILEKKDLPAEEGAFRDLYIRMMNNEKEKV